LHNKFLKLKRKLKKMDSEGEDQHFTKQGGEALNLDDNEGFNDSEEVDDVEDDEQAEATKKDPSPPKPAQ